MYSNVLGDIKVTVRGVTRAFEAIRINRGGADFGLPEKGFAFRQYTPGYAGVYIPVLTEADAMQAIRILAGEFTNILLEVEDDDE